MVTQEAYNEYCKYREVLELFEKTGHYVGGCDALFDFMKIPNKNCSSCKAQALIEALTSIRVYERNL